MREGMRILLSILLRLKLRMTLGFMAGLSCGVTPALAQTTELATPAAPAVLIQSNPRPLADPTAPLSAEIRTQAQAGQAIVVSREGQCTLCHQIPDYSGAMGNLGPPLGGVASRLTANEIQTRLKDSRLVNPYTIMPPYFSVEGLSQVDPKFKGQTILSETQFKQVLTYLNTLR
jgi:L-cysteine S-thiosulfotransferase